MRSSFVSELVCVRDGADLRLAFVEDRRDEEVWSGSLVCVKCGAKYAIRNGVPCMTDTVGSAGDESHFGTQWTWFLDGKFENPTASSLGESHEFIINDFFEQTGLTPETLHGKRILDAGSGASKIAYHLTKAFPATHFEIVSLEITEAVYRAYERVHELRTPHVRADVYKPGLRPESFDVVYSAGVLHHTSDPRRAFDALVPLLKPCGTMSTWMYSKRFNPFLDLTGLVWPIARHLPTRVILGMAYLLSPLYWVLFRAGCVFKRAVKPMSWRWRWVMPLSLAAIRLHLFDYMHTYYRFRYWPEEIIPWYEENGFDNVMVLRPGSAAIRAKKKAIGI